jgi:hypothetical protein
MNYAYTKKGITLFFTILIIGLMLGITASISLLAQKQLKLSTIGSQSELSFYSANIGAECALYWDKKGAPNPFDPSNFTTTNVVQCVNQSISIDPGLTRTFTVNIGSACANVTVTKTQVSGVWITQVESRGYNTCAIGAQNKLERAIYVSY